MERNKPYLSFSYPLPGPTAFLFKKAAEKNAVFLRGLTVEEHREANDRLADVRIISPGTRMRQAEWAGVPCEWVYRDDSPADRMILYLHGGSWSFGNLRTARPVGLQLNGVTGYRVLVVDYRLSPEHPYPAGLDDCLSVYLRLCESGFDPDHIGVFGDSAGGNLTLCMMHRLLALGKPLPAVLGLASPVTDMSGDSLLQRMPIDLMFTQYQGREENVFSLYCGDHDREDPLLSPVKGDLSDFPPMLIHVGQDEALCVDCDVFAEKAHREGADVRLKIWREMYHDFTIVGSTLKESRKSLAEFGEFFRAHLEEPQPPEEFV